MTGCPALWARGRLEVTDEEGPDDVTNRLGVDGFSWQCWPISAEERAWLRCLDGYVGSGGSEWVGGETDSDDDYYFPSGGSDGDDCDAY
eukprot:COSAG02_NODE_3092_length_7386_cov_2.686428_4_plen_89_part_00